MKSKIIISLFVLLLFSGCSYKAPLPKAIKTPLWATELVGLKVTQRSTGDEYRVSSAQGMRYCMRKCLLGQCGAWSPSLADLGPKYNDCDNRVKLVLINETMNEEAGYSNQNVQVLKSLDEFTLLYELNTNDGHEE